MDKPEELSDRDFEMLLVLLRLEAKQGADQRFKSQITSLKNEISNPLKTRKAKEAYAKKMLSIIKAGAEAGYYSKEEYVFHLSFYVEGMIHDERWSDGCYNEELDPINKRIKKLREEYGLADDEFWMISEGPPEYQKLSQAYDKILDKYRIVTFRELGENEIADLLETNEELYKKLVEQGREQVVEPPPPLAYLYTLIDQYKSESSSCARAGAFYAACATLGAALETLLLAYCYQRPDDVRGALDRLIKEHRPKSRNPNNWSLHDLIKVAYAAGWLPIFQIGDSEYHTSAWINLIRDVRNLLHPGKHLRGRPKVRIGSDTFEDASAVYTLIASEFTKIEKFSKKESRQT